MRRERTDRERLFDDAVLLYLWAGAQEKVHQTNKELAAGDRLKLTKLAFLAANDFYWGRTKALNLPFYRYLKGPYAKEINTNWDDLRRSNLMIEDEQFIVTEQGMKLARDFGTEVLGSNGNRIIRSTLDGIIEEYGRLDTEAILKRVYDMRCYTIASPGSRHKVSAIGMYADMTAILDEDEAEGLLDVSPGWEVTLELALHPDALRNLERGIADTYAGRLYGLEALGTDV